ncbi:MAG: Mn transporter [Patescibacteria group bacterium]|nr:MAG: Mn transporter [Patescibacteria group bacterium]
MNFLNSLKIKLLIILAVIGPGIITAFADNDAGGVATYSVAAAKFGYNIHLTFIPITLILIISQEIGGRIAVVTGKGLADLIRERYGIRISLLIFFLLSLVNFAVILQDIGGLKAGLELFNINIFIFLPLILLGLLYFITRTSYAKIEKFFLLLTFFYIAYLFSAILAKPDWKLHFKSIIIPYEHINFNYLYTAIAVLGTTVTAWGQFFINSYVKDKKISIDKLKINQLEMYVGGFLTNAVSMLMMIAVISTLWINHIKINDAASAALAIKPFAGEFASALFGAGLIIAGFMGAAIVPLATAYAFSEFFGYEGSLDVDFNKSKLFYGIFFTQIIIGMFFTLLPQFQLFQFTILADFLNGLFLPVIFFFLYKIANNEELMGKYKNTKLQNILLISSGIIITIGALLGGLGHFLGI